MIATLRGLLVEKLSDSLILEVGGVGYELSVTSTDWASAKAQTETFLYIYEQIREDAHNLYGFSELSSRLMFVQLLSVSGIGPKLAMQILSAAGVTRLRQAIASGDPDLLKGISGVGTKTAGRVIIELKGKVDQGAAGLAPVTDTTYQALVALGYSASQATKAVSELPPHVTGEQERLKLALQEVKQ